MGILISAAQSTAQPATSLLLINKDQKFFSSWNETHGLYWKMQLLLLFSVLSIRSTLSWYDKRKCKDVLINSAAHLWKEGGADIWRFASQCCLQPCYLTHPLKFEMQKKEIIPWIDLLCLSLAIYVHHNWNLQEALKHWITFYKWIVKCADLDLEVLWVRVCWKQVHSRVDKKKEPVMGFGWMYLATRF